MLPTEKYIKKKVEAVANTPAGKLTPIEVDKVRGYTKITGIAVLNKGTHTNWAVNVANHSDEAFFDTLPFELLEPKANERFVPLDIPFDQNEVLINVEILEPQAQALSGYVVLRISA